MLLLLEERGEWIDDDDGIFIDVDDNNNNNNERGGGYGPELEFRLVLLLIPRNKCFGSVVDGDYDNNTNNNDNNNYY